MKIHKEKTIKKIILVLLIMILGSTLIELGTNIKSLYMKNQNIMKIDEDHIELKGFVKKGKGYYLSNAEGVLRCDLNNKYVKKFVYDFDTGDMVDAEIKVGYDNSMGKEEVMIIEDKNPILLSESVVNVNKKVKWIEISLSSVEGGSGIYIKNIRINNQIEINKYRIFCSSVLILGICVCVIFRKKITKEIEYGFGIIALTLGIIFVISIPTNKFILQAQHRLHGMKKHILKEHIKCPYILEEKKFLQRYLDSLRRIHYTTILIFNHNHMKKSKI